MKRSEYDSIKELCDANYPKKKRIHAAAVESLVMQDPMYLTLDEGKKYMVCALAYAHDLIEDTDCAIEDVMIRISNDDEFEKYHFIDDLMLLTHKKSDSYYEYVRNIVNSRHVFAIMVKRADMLDHLNRKSTLTEKLKKKYLPVVPMLFYPRDVLR